MTMDQREIERVRSALRDSHDPRALRTRAALISATSALMHQTTATFTAEHIAQQAGVSRSSFYAHFSSAEAAALEVFRDTIAQIGRDSRGIGHLSSARGLDFARAATAAVVRHVAENQALYRSVLQLDLPSDAYAGVLADFTAVVHAAVLALDTIPPQVHPSTAATYITGGALAVLRHRITSPDPLDESSLVEELVGMIPDWFTSARFTASTPPVLHPADTD
jgi:AcrR family transcriptional regulator